VDRKIYETWLIYPRKPIKEIAKDTNCGTDRVKCVIAQTHVAIQDGLLEDMVEDVVKEKKGYIRYTNEELIKAYFELKERLGKQPSRKDIDRYRRGSCSETYRHRWGSWTNFLTSIGEPSQKKWKLTKKELIDAYFELKKDIGHQPRSTEISRGGYNLSSYIRHFSSWTKFLSAIGEK